MPKKDLTTIDGIKKSLINVKQFTQTELNMYVFEQTEKRADGVIVTYDTVDKNHAFKVITRIAEKFHKLIDAAHKVGKMEALELISKTEGWEDSRDKYAKVLGLETVYEITIVTSAVKSVDGLSVYTGKRHADCIKRAAINGEPTPIKGLQGFLTNKGVFVTREEAAEIAYKAGQIDDKKSELFSEDLW